MQLKMQENELYKTLFGKRKRSSSYESSVVSPSKELKVDSEDFTFSHTWSGVQNEKLKSLIGCERKTEKKPEV